MAWGKSINLPMMLNRWTTHNETSMCTLDKTVPLKRML